MLFFQIYGELQSLMFTETGLECCGWRNFLGTPLDTRMHQRCKFGSYTSATTSTWSLWFQSKTIPISWTSLHRHAAFGQQQLWRICQGQLSCPSAMGQLCCTAAQTYPQDACPHPCYSGWVSPLCYMSCLQETVHCRHWVQKLWINNPMNSLSFNLI